MEKGWRSVNIEFAQFALSRSIGMYGLYEQS